MKNGKAILRIEAAEDFCEILSNLKKFGIGTSIPTYKVYKSQDKFPIEIELDINEIFKSADNPIVRNIAGKITGKMNQTFTARVMAMI